MRNRLLILLIATLLQAIQFGQDVRFHPDEAYFMTFARNAAVNGDWMISGALDKPPLSIYTSAISMVLVGNTTDENSVLHLDIHQGEFAGRLPNIFFAISMVALMMRLAHDLYQDETITAFTGILTATSPYILAFGSTAFTDMSLLFWLTVSLLLIIRKKSVWTGLAFGVAFWSKQQAIFFLPLLFVLLLMKTGSPTNMQRHVPSAKVHILKFGIPIFISLVSLLIWDTFRPETSIFLLGTLNNAPEMLLADPSQYQNRFLIWMYFGAWLIGHPIWTFSVLFTGVMGLVWLNIKPNRSRKVDLLFTTFIFSYLLLHIIVAFNQYDRYLLLALPVLILLLARGISGFLEFALRYGGGRVGFIQLCLLSALVILLGGMPIGGDNGKHDEIDEFANYLNAKPIATVVYDRWLGWELGYYMGQWTNKRRVHYPTPKALVDDALALDEIGERYFIAPIDQPVEDWLDALHEVGFGIELDYESERFISYRLLVPASDA